MPAVERSLIEATIDVVVVVNLEGAIIYANHAAEDLSGYTGAQLAKLPIASLFVDALSGLQTQVRKQVGEGNAFQRDESWLVTKTNQRIPISLTVSPVVEDGVVIEIMIVGRDARATRHLIGALRTDLKRVKESEAKLRDDVDVLLTKLREVRVLVDEQLERIASLRQLAESGHPIGELERIGERLRALAG